MLRTMSAVAAGVVIWMAGVSLINFVPHYGWTDYRLAEATLEFTLAIMIVRLAMSAIFSLLSGYVAAWIDRGGKSGWIAGLIIMLLFLPDHIGLWGRFPAWYHLTS